MVPLVDGGSSGDSNDVSSAISCKVIYIFRKESHPGSRLVSRLYHRQGRVLHG